MPWDAWPSDETAGASAWMGHTSHVRRAVLEQTTGYNSMAIPRVKGKRCEAGECFFDDHRNCWSGIAGRLLGLAVWSN
jgi:hypothetical protein